MSRTYYTGQQIVGKRVSQEKERELFEKLRENRDDAGIRDEIVRAFLGFALRQALKDLRGRRGACQKAGLSEDDAISAANFGLMKAIDRFDPGRGVRFTTYAGWWIKKALHEARYAAHTVSVARSDRERFVAFRRQTADGFSASQIAEMNHLPEKEVERILALASGRQDPIEMFDRGGTNEPCPCYEGSQASPLDDLVTEEMLSRLEEAKKRLGLAELRLLHDRFSRKMGLKGLAAKNRCTAKTVESRLKSILCVLRFHLSSP